jgi:sugar lactone lactonase YvrE
VGSTLISIFVATFRFPAAKYCTGLADGIKIDEQGYMWTSVPNGFAVIDLANREVICQILLGINNSNVAFGSNGDVWLTGLNGVWKIQRKLKASQVA